MRKRIGKLGYCSLVLNTSADHLTIPDTSIHPHTCDLDVTKNIGNHSFTGIPICILNAPSVQLTETELKALHAMAGFCSYMA
ncbi:UNVERIFIED_CONTAM: hypothetical protein ABIC26_000228 [Paenibacillus sp. PvR008]